jgi:hypothetical protein
MRRKESAISACAILVNGGVGNFQQCKTDNLHNVATADDTYTLLSLAEYYSSSTWFSPAHKHQAAVRRNTGLQQGRTSSRAGSLAAMMRILPIIQQFKWLSL